MEYTVERRQRRDGERERERVERIIYTEIMRCAEGIKSAPTLATNGYRCTAGVADSVPHKVQSWFESAA